MLKISNFLLNFPNVGDFCRKFCIIERTFFHKKISDTLKFGWGAIIFTPAPCHDVTGDLNKRDRHSDKLSGKKDS